MMSLAGKVTTTESSLFGDIEAEDSLFDQRAELASHVRGELSKAVNDFMAVASERRAKVVGKAGNVLDTEANRKIAEEADRVKNVYDTLVNRKGAISDALNESAADLARAKSKKERDRVRQEAVERVRGAVFAEAGVGQQAEPDGEGQGADGGGAAAGAGGPAGAGEAVEQPADGGRGEIEGDGLTGPGIDLHDPAALGRAIAEVGRSRPDWAGNAPMTPMPKWDSHKLHVSELYDALKDRLGGASLDDFKAALLKGHGKNLHRNDMPNAGKDTPAKNVRSQITHPTGGGEYHVLDTAAYIREHGTTAESQPTEESPKSPSETMEDRNTRLIAERKQTETAAKESDAAFAARMKSPIPADAYKPAEGDEAAKLPERILDRVRGAVATIQEHERDVEQARHTDRMFAGGGRYESEFFAKRPARQQSLDMLAEFRKMAGKNGIDPDKVLKELGGVPDVQKSAAAVSWETPEELTPTKRPAAPEATAPQHPPPALLHTRSR